MHTLEHLSCQSPTCGRAGLFNCVLALTQPVCQTMSPCFPTRFVFAYLRDSTSFRSPHSLSYQLCACKGICPSCSSTVLVGDGHPPWITAVGVISKARRGEGKTLQPKAASYHQSLVWKILSLLGQNCLCEDSYPTAQKIQLEGF